MSNEYKREPYRPTAEERAAERNKQKHLRQQAALAHRSLQTGSRYYARSEVFDIFTSISAPSRFHQYAE